MATLNTIISWFESRKKPTAAQFAAAWSSFWHKDEPIALENIQGLSQILQDVATVQQVTNATNIAQEALDIVAQNYPKGKIAITPDGYIVQFENPYPVDSDYLLFPSCYNAEGIVGFTIIDRSRTGFTIVPVDNCLFEYYTIPL